MYQKSLPPISLNEFDSCLTKPMLKQTTKEQRKGYQTEQRKEPKMYKAPSNHAPITDDSTLEERELAAKLHDFYARALLQSSRIEVELETGMPIAAQRGFNEASAGGLLNYRRRKEHRDSRESTETRICFSSEVLVSDSEKTDLIPIREADGPKEINSLIGEIATAYFDVKGPNFTDEESFLKLFPDLSEEVIGQIASFSAKAVSSLREGTSVMLWDGSSRKIQPFWITAAGKPGQAQKISDMSEIVSLVYLNIRIKRFQSMYEAYSRINPLTCNITAIPQGPPALVRVPSY